MWRIEEHRRLDKRCSGEWKGHGSSRLGLQFRVIYRVVAKDMFFQVVSLTAHNNFQLKPRPSPRSTGPAVRRCSPRFNEQEQRRLVSMI